MTYYYGYDYGNDRKKKNIRRIILAVLILIVIGAITAFVLYRKVAKVNTWTHDSEDVSVFIPSGSDFKAVTDTLYSKGIIIDRKSFEWYADKRDYPEHVKGGHYVIHDRMTNHQLVKLLNSGCQSPVKVTFNNVRDIYQLSEKVSKQIEASYEELTALLEDSAYLSSIGFDRYTVPALFIPNTYQFYWTTSAEKFVSRMVTEYNSFWNETRRAKADSLGLTTVEVSILASIVEKETTKIDEMPTIAGVYLNRLDKKWRLQADPTLVFALGDFEIKRILNEHKKIESPYNTYANGGLPPGPIYIPSTQAINAVLNAENHKYMYFCAKPDHSGYHAFAKTNDEHQRNSYKYHQSLDKLKIR